jgi:hypothetical protein
MQTTDYRAAWVTFAPDGTTVASAGSKTTAGDPFIRIFDVVEDILKSGCKATRIPCYCYTHHKAPNCPLTPAHESD